MITVDQAFEKFRQRLELSESEAKDASHRHNDVRDCIRQGFEIDRDFLTGSYARHTKTKPLKDVDIFFCLGEKDRQWRNRPPAEVLDAFRKRLALKYGDDSVKRGRRCVTVEFDKHNTTEDDERKVLSNDAVPAIELDTCYEIPDCELGSWIKTDPDIHNEKSTAKNRNCGGKWVPLVKMLKRWNRSVDKPISPSFLVEVMTLELIDPPFTSFPGEVRRFFAAAQEGIMRDWPDPAGYGPPVSDQMTVEKRREAVAILRAAEVKASRAVYLEREGKTGEALAQWREIMGKYFPLS